VDHTHRHMEGVGMDRIDQLRHDFEAALLRIDGVVGVSQGLDERGRPHLRVLCALPIHEIEPRLPEAVRADTLLVFVGEIEAQ